MSDDYIGVKIDGVIYVKLDDVKPMGTRIEKLEAALREIDTIAINHTKGGIGKAQSIARKALEGKDD